MLAEIERSNLFLVSLDETGTAYRYHHLFAAMLKRELEATNPEAVPELHARASSWLDANGEVDAAIDHAIAGRDVPRASALVARRGPALWSSGRVTTVARWLAALSWPEAEADRVLALARSQVAGLTGRGRDELEHWLRIAEAGPDEGPLTSGIASIRCGVAMQRSGYLTRGLEAAEREARIALELEPLESPWRRVALVLLGQALYMLGRPDEARAPLEEARSLPGAEQMAPGAALGWSYLALVVLNAGDAADAERIARAALDFVEERQLAGVAAANPHLALGCALAHGPDLHAAIAHLERAVELVAPAGATYWRAHALVRLAAARHRLGEARAASDALARARADLDELPDVGMLGRLHEETAKALLSRRRREGYLGEALSEAELRILHRLAAGQSLGTVAHELWLSPNTVKTHRRSIYRKLGATTRDELLRIVGELGILEASVEKEPPAL
jgi:LuxR family maltose regulon positive regulatory protein